MLHSFFEYCVSKEARMDMKYNLQGMYGIAGDVAVITGATGGIGKEVARALGGLGVKLALVVRKDEQIQQLKINLNH